MDEERLRMRRELVQQARQRRTTKQSHSMYSSKEYGKIIY